MRLEVYRQLDDEEKKRLLSECCGSSAWVQKMLTITYIKSVDQLLELAEQKWHECNEADWKEAFAHHPKIGDLDSLKKKFSSDRFAGREQSGVTEAPGSVLRALALSNKVYQENYGYIFIVCATGKSAEEMLDIINARLQNDPATEIKIAMEEQNKITKIRLKKLFDA